MLLTKFHIPSTCRNIVHRPGLFEKLTDGLNRKLTLVSAPAGYGKTTLLCDWIRQNNISVAWCSIDARDNDPIEFLKIIITAVQNKHDDIGKSSLELLKSPGTASIDYIIELFINDLLNLKNEIVLVLDDFHLINNKQVIDIFSLLIEYKPKYLKLTISTRSDPLLTYARLRSQNEIIEIRSSDLSFSIHDISDFLNKKLSLGLSDKDLKLLEHKTEGWIAGLQLTAITIKGHDNISAYIEKMAGDNRYIMDYLMEEVLDIQSDEMLDFLLYTSLLEKFTSSLCDAILEKNNSQLLLESLDKSNMFLVPLDDERQWYRYHHLFGDLLKQKLTIRDKDKIPELHKKASIWFETYNLPEFAIEHSLKGGNPERAIQLLEEIIEDSCQNLEYYKIYKFGSLFNEKEIITSKIFCVTYAWILALNGNIKGAELYLNKLRNLIPADKPEDKEIIGKIYLAYSSISISTGNVESAFKYSELALKYLPKKENSWNVWAYITNAEAHLLRFELNKSLKSYESAINICRKINNIYLMMISVSNTAYALKLKGKYHERYKICKELLETLTSIPNVDRYKLNIATSILYSIIGFVQIEWNLLEEGMQNVIKGYEFSQNSLSISLRGHCTLIYAEVCIKAGEINKAISLLNKLEVILETDISYGINTAVNSFKNKLFIRNGELEKVFFTKKTTLENNRNNIFEYYFNNIAKARYFISQQNYIDALNLLEELSESLKKDEAYYLLIEAELLKAKAFANQNEKNNAIQSILNAILYAQSEGLIRTFIVEGKEINELLKEVKHQKSIKSSEVLDSVSTDFLNKLLEAFKKEERFQKFNSEEILSDRELDTLKLMTESLTNQNIADEMYISINTVKTHIRNILLKLDAKNRKEALMTAKEKGILRS